MMGCCGEREKFGDLRVEQKWEYINLNDFKARSCWTGFAYGYLWFMLIVSISVYAVDTFTAINLLAFDRWAGRIAPAIPLRISRWIFAGCIILSFVLLIYRWIRAIKVMQQGGVAKSYLDPLAVRLQSIRMGQNGRGWKRFLVFAELTKSKKGADYVALFSYFSFEAWLRIVFAEGPRQVINGITLYSVTKSNLLPEGKHSATNGNSKFSQFWINVGLMAEQDRLQAIVLLGMLWTLFIWVLAAISLAISVALYLIFLWHHIPSGDGGLARYCRIKINRRMERIVKTKMDKALKKENELRARQEAKAAREGLEKKKEPTLPSLDPTVDSLPLLSRQTTFNTLPEYTSQPGSPGNSRANSPAPPVPSLPQAAPSLDIQPSLKPRRSDTSWSSYASNAPLVNQAADMAYSPLSAGPANPNPYVGPGAWNGRSPPPPRNMTATAPPTLAPGGAPVPTRPPTAQSGRHTPRPNPYDPIARPGTAVSSGGYASPYLDGRAPMPARGMPPTRSATWDQPVDTQGRRTPAQNGNPYFPPILETDSGRSSPAPSYVNAPFSAAAPPPSLTAGPPSVDRSRTPMGPPRSLTAGPPSSAPSVVLPPRSATAGPPSFDRSRSPVGPPPSLTAGPLSSDRSLSPVGVPPRSFTAGPPSSGRSRSPFRALPPRSFSAGGVAPGRWLAPGGYRPEQPTLPQVDTYDDGGLLDSYRTVTPEPLSSAASQSSWRPRQDSNASLEPATLQRQETTGSVMDDILRHY